MGKHKLLEAPVPTEPEISIRHNAAPFARMCEGGNLIIGHSPSCIRPSMKRISILRRKKQDETLLGQTPRRITRSRSIAIELSFETCGPTNPISPTSPTLNLILSLSPSPPPSIGLSVPCAPLSCVSHHASLLSHDSRGEDRSPVHSDPVRIGPPQRSYCQASRRGQQYH